jgi:signal transduction histidine kinase
MKTSADISPEIREEFHRYTVATSLRNSQVAYVLVAALMPAGFALDYFVFPQHVKDFLFLRICSSLLALLLLVFLARSRWPEPVLRVLSAGWYVIPSAAISFMVLETGGFKSSYYAGLNLVILAACSVIQATLWESLISVFIILSLYLAAGIWSNAAIISQSDFGVMFNNAYFLVLTAIIVVTGNYFYNGLRLREFMLRHELDKNRKSLEETNRKLVELDRLKSRFFANISHELRTPLTLMLGPLESLMKNSAATLDAATQELVQTMHANGMRLLKLINDLLELIRLESGRAEAKAEPMPVAEFMNGLASAVRQMAKDKNITLEVQPGVELGVVLADRDKLEKIVLNLLFNALKFTPAGGRVWFHAEKSGEHFLLTVGDSGVGIDEKNLPHVFDRFWQADNSSKRQFQGVGIGLALVKELTEMMNGIVSVQSQLGKGAVFALKLPFRPAAVAVVVPETPVVTPTPSEEWLANLYRRAEIFPVAGGPKPLHSGNTAVFTRRSQRPLVLVADDEPDMRRFLVVQLSDEYEVVEAADGLQAAEKAQQILPDIILLDLMMPHKDGLQVCRELREYAPTANIPIILLTARADEAVKFDALQKGANDFLAKPFSSVELFARIKNLIESHHSQRKLAKQNVALSDAIEQIKETEMQLVQSEKLSSLGRMSAGIIHEINNPLNFAMTGLFALRAQAKKLPEGERMMQEGILTDIEEGLKRVRNIVSDLRQFTHPGVGTGEPVEAADAADAAVRFLGGEWKDTVRVHQNIPAAQTLWANRNKLIHVLVNLMQNALDALHEKQFPPGEQAQIWLEGRVDGHRSLIIVRDNGPGVDPKIADKIFDPFFTTKEVGKGMGLGLSICYRIVQGYGGKISVQSEPGKSCRFTLDFPLDAEAAEDLEVDGNGEAIRL